MMVRTTNHRHLIGLIAGVVAAMASSASTVAVGPASAPPGEDQRVEFAPGTDNAAVQGTVAAGFNDRYVLGARAGQVMIVGVESPEGLAIARVFGPNDTVQQPSDLASLTVELPFDGDYIVEVSTIRDVTDYTVNFQITEPPPVPAGTTDRIEFEPGTNSASVTGAVVRGTSDTYVLRASAGQTMVVHVDSVELNAAFNVFGPDRNSLIVEQQQATVPLPASGDYVIEVVATRANATYRMTVWIE